MKPFALWPIVKHLERIAAALEQRNKLEHFRQEHEFGRAMRDEALPRRTQVSNMFKERKDRNGTAS